MKFYIDVEATSPAEEIISIGVVNEFGNTFQIYVNPTFSKLDSYISNLTGITQSNLDDAPYFNDAMRMLAKWITIDLNCKFKDAEFYSYGEDVHFFKVTGKHIEFDSLGYAMYSCIITNITDISKDVFKFFNGTVSLNRAFNYINSIEKDQRHDALEDAQMLRQVVNFTTTNEPYEINPCVKPVTIEEVNFNMPKGRFYCRRSKNGVEREFNNCAEAIEWLIETHCDPASREKVHRNRVMSRIMKAARTNTKYHEYYWRRAKGR